MTAQDFMNFFRSDDFHQQMSTDDCVEVFRTVLKGSNDITAELIEQLCIDYSVDVGNLTYELSPYQGLRGEILYRIECLESDKEITESEAIELKDSLDDMNDSLMSNDWLWDTINPIIQDEIDERLKELRGSQE